MGRNVIDESRTARSRQRTTGEPSACKTSIRVSAGDFLRAASVSRIQVWPAFERNR